MSILQPNPLIPFTQPDEELTLKEAARRIHKRVKVVRDLVESGALKAYKRGGTDANPRLVVCCRELQDAYRQSTVYVPKGKSHAE
jgi:hypothetical protein